ncbi:MAG: arginine--tRNA ligase [Metamycoplasmataceae bacterium]
MNMNNLKDIISKQLDSYLKNNQISNIKYQITIPSVEKYGDFSTNIALLLSKEIKEKPQDIANKIVKDLKHEFIEKIEVIPNGFINFFVSEKYFNFIINSINIQDKNYGNIDKINKRINLEFVSANPTGFLHVAHARGASYGDSLANILETQGIDVFREYYINDAGAQVKNLAKSAFTRYQEIQKVKLEFDLNEDPDLYRGIDIIWVAEQLILEIGDIWKNKKFSEVEKELTEIALKIVLKKIKSDLALLNVNFNLYFSELDLYNKNMILPIIDKLNDKFEKDGALWLNTEKYGDDKNRVLIKSDGTYTYFLPDIAYHNIKISREPKVDKLINIWGADHTGYIKRMKVALKLSGYSEDDLDVITLQLVRLIKEGQELKMSKRKGTSLFLFELVKTVGKDATRFFLVNRSSNTKIDFNLNLATLKSNENPVFSIQYAHARCIQLLKKANFNFKEVKEDSFIPLNSKKLIKLIENFPLLLAQISENYKVHLLCSYLIELTTELHSFYSNNPIIGSKDEIICLKMINAVKIILAKGLNLLGISAPDKL